MPPLLNYSRLNEFVQKAEDEGGIEENQESEATEWITQLSQLEIENEEEVANLHIVFKAAKAIMEFEAAQAGAAMEEAEEQGKKVAELEDQLESERETLKEEISKLRMELAGGATGGGQEGTLRAEIQSLREENENLMMQNRQRDMELADATEKYDRVLSKLEGMERDAKEERSRRLELENTVQDLKRRSTVQQESQAGRRNENEQLQKKLKERSDELLKLIDEVNNLNVNNELLAKEEKKLKESLAEATKQMEKTTDRYVQLKEALRAADDAVEILEKENNELKQQLAAPKEEQASAYDQLMAAVDKKIEEWKGLLQTKDKTIEQNKQQIEKLQQEIIEFSIDTDKASVAALTKAIEDRDKQISVLKTQLEQATSEMDRTVDMIVALQSQIHGEGGASALHKRMSDMATKMKEHEKRAIESVQRAEEAEKAAAERDSQMTDCISQLRQYEKGEYGLADAVRELNDAKVQLGFRDKQLAEMSQKFSKAESELHEVLEENESMRETLGLDKRKAKKQKELVKKADIQKETDKALNVILSKEIERLEDERLQLKLQLRKSSQKLGQRAAALGLSADDLLAIDQFTEELQRRRGQDLDEWKQKFLGQSTPADKTVTRTVPDSTSDAKVHSLYQENSSLRTRLGKIEAENGNLLQALKELNSQEGHSPALDLLLARLEPREAVSTHADPELKTKVDKLSGQTEELRSELHNSQSALVEAKTLLQSAQEKNTKLEEEVEEMRTKTFQAVQLPTNMPVTSSMLIMHLNEHLIQLLQENSLKSDQLKGLQEAVSTYGSKLAVLKHTQGIIYKEHSAAQTEWNAERDKLKEQYGKLQETHESSQIKLQEYDRLLDSLDKDESEMRRRLSEMTRRYTVMRINEAIMVRKYGSLEQTERMQRNEKDRIHKEMMRMEATISEKLAYLRHQKDMASFEIAGLHKNLASSVPLPEFETVKTELQNLSEKHRKLMEKEAGTMQAAKFDADLQLAFNRLQKEHQHVQKLWQAEKEKVVKYEATFGGENRVISGGKTAETGSSNLDYLAERIAALEMKELNERQRAEHAQQMYDTQRDQLRMVEERNSDLERKVEEIGDHNLKLQSAEQKLRDELSSCVTKEIHNVSMSRIAELEQNEASLRAQIDSFKSVSEVAQNQIAFWQKTEKLHDVEMQEMRNCIRDLQAESDQKTIIGRLHRELVHMKLADVDTHEQLKMATNRIRTLDNHLLRAEQRYDMKERSVQHLRIENVHRVAQLRKTIETLRMRFSGAVSLAELEKLHKALGKVHDDRLKIRKELVEAIDAAGTATLQSEELKLRQASLEELISTLKEGETAKRVADWHEQLEILRLKELRLTRGMKKLEHQRKEKDGEIHLLESALNGLEEENVKLAKENEERQLRWEIREQDLESRLNHYVSAERWEDGQLAQVQRDSEGMPDPSLPLAIQLEQCMTSLRKQLSSVSSYRKENEALRKANGDLSTEKRRLETQMLASERLALQMQSYVPVSEKSDVISSYSDRDDINRVMQMMSATVDALKAQLAQKDEAIDSYRDLVKSAQNDLSNAELRHQEQLREIKESNSREAQERMARLREESDKLINRENGEIEESLTMKIADLQVEVEELKNANALLAEKLKEARFDRDRLQASLDQIRSKSDDNKSEHKKPPSTAKTGSKDHSKSSSLRESPPKIAPIQEEKLAEKEEPVLEKSQKSPDVIEQEPESGSESSSSSSSKTPTAHTETVRSSSKSAKSQVTPPRVVQDNRRALELKVKCDRLRDQLSSKDKENQALSRALEELRREMMTLAVAPRKGSSENGMRDLEIKDLKRKIEDLEEALGKRSRDAKRGRGREDELISELHELKGELSRKDNIVSRLRQDKSGLEKENDNLERRLSHLRESVKMKLQESENRDLKKKLSALEYQMEAMKKSAPAEKPFDTLRSSNGVAKWEESKKWQRTAEKLKERLGQKSAECEGHEKMIARLKERINRLEQEKLVLSENRTSPHRTAPDTKHLERQNASLQLELQTLRNRGASDDSTVTRLETENLRLKEMLAGIEEQLQQAQAAMAVVSRSNGSLEVSNGSASVVAVLERVLKESQNDKIRLEAELEKSRSDRDALSGSFESLHQQISALQHELNSVHKDKPQRSGAIETVNRLHSTVERLEAEKGDLEKQLEELRLGSSRLPDPELQRLLRENREMKDKLSRNVHRVAWAEQSKNEKQDKAVEKLAEENHRLRRDLRKEQYETESLREELTELRSTHERLQADMRRLHQLNNQKRKWHPGSSGASTMMVEEKLKAKESILSHKEARIEQLEQLLRLEVEKNQTMLFENRRLKNKVAASEWVPTREMGSEDITRQIRHIKSELAHLEGENNELKSELEVLNRHIKPAIVATDIDVLALKERLKNYERVLKENIDLKLEKNSLIARQCPYCDGTRR